MKILSILTLVPGGASEPPNPAGMEKMNAFMIEARSQGVLLDTGGRGDDMIELQVARKDGKTTITDGPFTEAKEFVGGYALMEVKDRADAIAWTNRFLDIIGNATCHIHEVSSAP